MTQRITEMSPRFLARMAAVLGVLEGVASVNGQLRIPGRLVVTTDAAATAANILGHESLFRLGLALCVLAVAFNIARTVLIYVLFRRVGCSTYLWPPLARCLDPYDLALGVGELVLGFWLLVFGVNVER